MNKVAATTYNIHLESEQDTTATSNFGTINFRGTNYNLPDVTIDEAGIYAIQYSPETGYIFDHWEATGSITVTDEYEESTTVTVSGDGTLTAVYIIESPTPDFVTWYWGDDTVINSTVVADVDGDGQDEIVTGGSYFDGTRNVAQLAVWSSTLTLENIRVWYWSGDTTINSIAVANVDSDADMEIITGGSYNDGTQDIAQLAVWNGATLALENVQVWYWSGDTTINAVSVANVDGDADVEIVTGGSYNDGARDVAQLAVWNGASLSLENVQVWYWTGDTKINSIEIANVDGDADVEIVSGGSYNDGARDVAQLAVWNGASLSLENVQVWYWTGRDQQ